MKHNFKELDQFFDAARNGSPLMDDDVFASIVANADAAVPTEVMKLSPTSRIMSAFKHQGGMTMTGLGLTALSGILVTGYYLNTEAPDQKPIQQVATVAAVAPNSASLNTEAETSEPQIASVITTPKPSYSVENVMMSLSPEIEPSRFPVALSTDSLWARIESTIKPIEVTAEEVDKLGINDGGDGKVFLVHELKKGGVQMRMTFPPEGLSIRTSEAAIGTDDVSNIRSSDVITLLMPTMVTDVQGKKLAFFFKANAKSNGADVSTMSFSQRDGDATDAPIPSPTDSYMRIGENAIELNNVIINDDGGLEIGRELDVEDELEAEKEYELRINGDKQETMKIRQLPKGMQFKFNHNSEFDSMMPKRFSAHVIMSDSALKDRLNMTFDFKHDSSSFSFDANSMRQRMQGWEKHAMQFRMNFDSLESTLMQGLEGLNFDSLRKDMKLLRQSIQVRNLETLKNLPSRIELPHFQADRINNLVPIKIRDIDPNVKHNSNGLIFWYSRDAKFAEKAPATLVDKIENQLNPIRDDSKRLNSSVSKVSVINEPMVFPNPSPGRTMFKYSLAEPRAVSIAIHDLLGKRVMNVSDLESKAAGTFEKEIDLSSLESGVYLLIMVTDAGEQITQRVVLEK